MKKTTIRGILAPAFLAATALAASPALAETVPAPATSIAEVVDQAAAVADPERAAIAAALASLDQSKLSFVEKRRQAAVAGFYRDRGDAPAWIVDGFVSNSARAVVARLEAAAEDGLSPAALGIPVLADSGVRLEPAELAVVELALSRAVVAFAEEASAGRVDPARIDKKNITRKPEHIDPIAALSSVAASDDVASVLEGFNPPHEGFRRLKAKLAEVRARGDAPPPEPIQAGATLKPGLADPRVPLVRARLELPPVEDATTTEVYDDALVEAVKAFQKGAGLVADGIVGSRTLAVLNGEDRDEEGEILANMEMWRWMPRELGADHILVNIPEFMVRVVRGGRQIHEARVVVGTVQNQTPIFSDEMDHLVVNPYWHVPESIKTKEFLPEIQADPGTFFRRHGYEVTWNGQVIDPASVIWDENAVRAVGIRQVPSERNALGRIKFMFPNKHAVYLHDTPSRKLFDRDFRAYSHGCVRVHEPLEFAAALLEGEPVWNAEKIQALFGGNEKRIDLQQHIPVHLGYFNVWVDDAGTLQMRDDLYGHSAKVKAALKS